MTGRRLWFIVPQGLDDRARVSGGNVFDQRVRDGLRRLGWEVSVIEVAPDAAPRVADALASLPHDALVLVDGLVGVRAAAAIEAVAARLRLVLLAHMVFAAFPGADPREVDGERRVLGCAERVIVTSAWAGSEVVARGLVAPERILVATPGADDAAMASGTPGGTELLCVGVIAAHKGQDTLVDALARLDADLAWTCTIAGSATVEPAFAARVADCAARAGLAERITWAGVLTRDPLESAYARADLLVAPSRSESYGMAVSDALRRGIPVVATRVGGIPEAVAPGDGALLVSPDRPDLLAAVLRRWIVEPGLRARMTATARRHSAARPGWSDTVSRIDAALGSVRSNADRESWAQ